jgi:hypothetical protein
VPSQIILNGDGTVNTNYDQRTPKEVSLQLDGNTIDPSTLQSLEGGQRVFQTSTRTETSKDGIQGNQGSYGIQQHGQRTYKGTI